LNATLWR